jgi:hypothetical protein
VLEEFGSVVLVGTGEVEVELGTIELDTARLVYREPRTLSTFWTGERLSFELKYTSGPPNCVALVIFHPVEDMSG